MYHAKAGGRESLARFEITMLEDLNEKVALSRALRQALTNNELFVVYQPQYDLHDGRLTGFEALARWESPEFGLVSPNRFIPIAEDSGLILRLGEWVMNQACTDIVALEEALGMPLRLAVNVSARQLRGADWLTQIIDTLERTHVVPSRFAMEITESTLLEDHHEVRGALAQLREHGIKVVVDDFGQGYSSLAYLTTLPVDEIKLDRSFVEALGRDRGSDAIVDAILTMAQALDMDVVAEGVETLAQEDYLRSRGCDHVQGFLYGCGVRVADAKNATTHIGRP